MNHAPEKCLPPARHTFYRLVKRGIELISKKHIRLGRFYLLAYDGIPDIGRTRGPGEIRLGTKEEVESVGLANHRSEMFLSRYDAGDRCMVAVVGDRIVGYEWLCCGDQHREERYLYRIRIPSGSMYCYNAHIDPQYRISGIWLKFKNYIGGLMRENGKDRIITLIDYDNIMSINTHIRFGFHVFMCVTALRIFGIALSRETPLGENGRPGILGSMR